MSWKQAATHQHLIGLQQMVHVGPGVPDTGVARAAGDQACLVEPVREQKRERESRSRRHFAYLNRYAKKGKERAEGAQVIWH